MPYSFETMKAGPLEFPAWASLAVMLSQPSYSLTLLRVLPCQLPLRWKPSLHPATSHNNLQCHRLTQFQQTPPWTAMVTISWLLFRALVLISGYHGGRHLRSISKAHCHPTLLSLYSFAVCSLIVTEFWTLSCSSECVN